MNITKQIMLLSALITPLSFAASYSAKVPLEVLNGGRLPDNSIIIGSGNSNGNNQNDDSNCLFNPDNGDFIVVVKLGKPDTPYTVGDTEYYYDGDLIGYNLAGYSKHIPAGVKRGKLMNSMMQANYYQICGDNLNTKPVLNHPLWGGLGGSNDNAAETACLDKRSTVDGIASSYGATVTDLYYMSTSGNCMADVNNPSDDWNSGIIQEFESVGVNIAL